LNLTSKGGVISPWGDLHVAEIAEDIVVQIVHQVTLELQSVFLYRFTLYDKVRLTNLTEVSVEKGVFSRVTMLLLLLAEADCSLS
jgi:hypothetical protein